MLGLTDFQGCNWMSTPIINPCCITQHDSAPTKGDKFTTSWLVPACPHFQTRCWSGQTAQSPLQSQWQCWSELHRTAHSAATLPRSQTNPRSQEDAQHHQKSDTEWRQTALSLQTVALQVYFCVSSLKWCVIENQCEEHLLSTGQIQCWLC